MAFPAPGNYRVYVSVDGSSRPRCCRWWLRLKVGMFTRFQVREWHNRVNRVVGLFVCEYVIGKGNQQTKGTQRVSSICSGFVCLPHLNSKIHNSLLHFICHVPIVPAGQPGIYPSKNLRECSPAEGITAHKTNSAALGNIHRGLFFIVMYQPAMQCLSYISFKQEHIG